MIQKARFNSIIFLLAFFGVIVFGLASGAEAAIGLVCLMLMIWFFVMLASFIKLAITGRPLLYSAGSLPRKAATTQSTDLEA